MLKSWKAAWLDPVVVWKPLKYLFSHPSGSILFSQIELKILMDICLKVSKLIWYIFLEIVYFLLLGLLGRWRVMISKTWAGCLGDKCVLFHPNNICVCSTTAAEKYTNSAIYYTLTTALVHFFVRRKIEYIWTTSERKCWLVWEGRKGHSAKSFVSLIV